MKIDDVKRILVVGAGQMGAQIAMQSALHGYAITLNDLGMDVLQKGMAGNRKQLERRVQKGQMTKDQMEEALARVRLEADLESPARGADFVLEDHEGGGPGGGAARGGPRTRRARRRLRHRGHRGAARAEEGMLRPARPLLPAAPPPGPPPVHPGELPAP